MYNLLFFEHTRWVVFQNGIYSFSLAGEKYGFIVQALQQIVIAFSDPVLQPDKMKSILLMLGMTTIFLRL